MTYSIIARRGEKNYAANFILHHGFEINRDGVLTTIQADKTWDVFSTVADHFEVETYPEVSL